MLFTHFQLNLMPTNGYFGMHCNRPINIAMVFLMFKLVFILVALSPVCFTIKSRKPVWQ